MLVFLLFYLFIAFSYFNSDNQAEALRILGLKIPLLLFPLVYFAIQPLQKKHHLTGTLIINYALYVPAIVSVYNYLSNKELFDDLILQSKPLPVEFGYGILHIQFSILLACGILYGLFILVRNYKTSQHSLLYYSLLFLVVCNFIFIHILSARTGLVGLYAGIAIFCISLLATLPFKKTRWLLLAIVIVPTLMVSFSSSLQNRIKNTIADLNVVLENKDANDYSFAMRVKAWQNAIDVIAQNPIRGVGLGDAEEVLYHNFSKVNPTLAPENRKNPHFQFLETAVQSGLIAAFLYLLIVFLGFIKTQQKFNFELMAFLALLLVASCFESILESQSNVIPFVFFIALGLGLQANKSESTIY